MEESQVFDVIARHTREVLPNLDDYQFKPDDSLKALGANSIDRSEIVMMTLESLSIDIPLIELARAENMGQLASLLHAKLA